MAVLLNTTGNAGAHPDFELTLAFSPQSVTAGAKAQYGYVVEGTNGPLPPVQLSCSGLPKGTSCLFDGDPMGANLFGFLNISTTAQNSAAVRPRGRLYFALLPFGFFALPGGRRKKALLLMLVIIGAMLLIVGCGGVSIHATRMNGGVRVSNTGGAGSTVGANSGGNAGGTSGGTTGGVSTPTAGPTPSGTYQVSVTAKTADVTRTGTVTLIVQ